MTVDI